MKDFGLNHSDIARRAPKLNQATSYRVIEGETRNPSLSSITGIVEAVSLTDADAGVLYRKFGVDSAKPRLLVCSTKKSHGYTCAKRETQNYLDSGQLKEAARSVMHMFDLAQSDEEFSITYELAGIVYMGLGRWEEAQVNFEAADVHLPYNIDDPKIEQHIVNRKHTLMTNIASLMVKQKHLTWAKVIGQSIVAHPRVCNTNKGWGHLVLGEVALGFDDPASAHMHFQAAWKVFQEDRVAIACGCIEKEIDKNRCTQQSNGNLRWTLIHILKTEGLLGDEGALKKLQSYEKEWWTLDPEASVMAGLFHAELLPFSKRRKLILKNIKTRAKRNSFGEVLMRISQLLGVLLVLGGSLSFLSTTDIYEEGVMTKSPKEEVQRGNTGR